MVIIIYTIIAWLFLIRFPSKKKKWFFLRRLMKAIQFQVDYCADNNIFTHNNPDGGLGDRFQMFDYKFRSSGENLAKGFGPNDEIQVVKL